MLRKLFSVLLILLVGLALAAFEGAGPLPCRQPQRPEVEPGTGARGLPVLIYHHLAPASVGLHRTNAMVVSAEAFAQQMAWLSREGYYTPTLQEVEAFVAGRLELPAKSVLITFDDGYASNYEHAHPVLCAAGLRAVVYRIGNRGGAVEGSALTYLTSEQAAKMHQSGLWAVENHSFHGHDLVEGEAPYLRWSVEEIAADLAGVAAKWQEEGLPAPTSIAYPFGFYGEHTLEAARRAGLRTGFTTEPGLVRPGLAPLKLPRLAVFSYHSLEHVQRMVRGEAQP
ncbi:MAG: polysaccharide deacetylase family protein [Bacillota bacterium]